MLLSSISSEEAEHQCWHQCNRWAPSFFLDPKPSPQLTNLALELRVLPHYSLVQSHLSACLLHRGELKLYFDTKLWHQSEIQNVTTDFLSRSDWWQSLWVLILTLRFFFLESSEFNLKKTQLPPETPRNTLGVKNWRVLRGKWFCSATPLDTEKWFIDTILWQTKICA